MHRFHTALKRMQYHTAIAGIHYIRHIRQQPHAAGGCQFPQRSRLHPGSPYTPYARRRLRQPLTRLSGFIRLCQQHQLVSLCHRRKIRQQIHIIGQPRQSQLLTQRLLHPAARTAGI